MPQRIVIALVVLSGAFLIACGGGETPKGHEDATLYAAASLKEVLPVALGTATYSFAGSDTLALQIREGAPADLFVAASPRYPDELADESLCETPVGFATNTLALLVPAGNPRGIEGVEDLLRGGPYRLAIGDPSVPIGAYTREALDALDAEVMLERNTVSEEPDASSLVAKVALGSADAAIAYATDATRGDGKVEAIPLPPEADPTVVYTACVVARGDDTTEAQALLERLLGPDGQAALEEAGFGPAP